MIKHIVILCFFLVTISPVNANQKNKKPNIQPKPKQTQETNYQPIKPLNNNGFSFNQNTSVTGNLNNLKNNNQCGISIYTEANNANTLLESTFSVGINWSQKKCVNEMEIAEINAEIQIIQSEKEISIRKITAQEKIITDCLALRAKALEKKQNPDKICKIPRIELFDDIQ